MQVGVANATEQNIELNITGPDVAPVKLKRGQGRVRVMGYVAFCVNHNVY